MIIGFAWGGWTTSGTTQKMSKEAVVESQAGRSASPNLCQFMKDPSHEEKFKEFK
jgi:hypothetical protein